MPRHFVLCMKHSASMQNPTSRCLQKERGQWGARQIRRIAQDAVAQIRLSKWFYVGAPSWHLPFSCSGPGPLGSCCDTQGGRRAPHTLTKIDRRKKTCPENAARQREHPASRNARRHRLLEIFRKKSRKMDFPNFFSTPRFAPKIGPRFCP